MLFLYIKKIEFLDICIFIYTNITIMQESRNPFSFSTNEEAKISSDESSDGYSDGNSCEELQSPMGAGAASPLCEDVSSPFGSPCARKKPHDAPKKKETFKKLLKRRTTIVPCVLDPSLCYTDLPKKTVLQAGKHIPHASSKAHQKNISKLRLVRDKDN